MPRRIIARAVAAALTAAIALALFVGSAVAQPYYLDTLVTGTITGGATGGTVSVYSGTTPCKTIAGGTIAADGTYQVVVNCDVGTGTLYVDGAATSTTFTLIPGTVSSGVNATIGTAPSSTTTTPGATGTAATTGTATTGPAGATTATTGTTTASTGAAGTPGAPGAPGSESEGPTSGSSHAWIFFVAGLGLLALGAGGVVALRMRRRRVP